MASIIRFMGWALMDFARPKKLHGYSNMVQVMHINRQSSLRRIELLHCGVVKPRIEKSTQNIRHALFNREIL